MQADFTDADVSDVLWDRAVINEAILRNAILQRTVFTSSDLGGADIYGARQAYLSAIIPLCCQRIVSADLAAFALPTLLNMLCRRRLHQCACGQVTAAQTL